MIRYYLISFLTLASVTCVLAEESGQSEIKKAEAAPECPQTDFVCIGANKEIKPPTLKSDAGGVKAYGGERGGGGGGYKGMLMDKLKYF